MKTKQITLLIIILIFAFKINAQQQFNFDGEQLKYIAKYGFIKGGEVTITSKRISYENKDCYDVKIDMFSTGIVDDLFRFHDIFRSIFSAKTMKPYKFIRDAHEGSYSQYEEVNYCENYVESSIKGKFETSEHFYDIVSGIFALRVQNWNSLKINEVLILPIYFDEQIVNTKIIYKGKERIKIKNKYYSCHKFLPKFENIKIFSKDGVSIYFSDDYTRKPVCIKVSFRVGSFKVELME